MRRPALLLIALTAMIAAGCGVLRSLETGGEPWVRADSLRPVNDNESLLMYFEYVRKLSPAELAKEHDTVRHLYANSRSDFNRVRYAMLLSVSGAAFNDEARALEALEPLLRNPDAALHNLAFMMSAQIQERRRGQGLQHKLDALKSLEKSLIDRDPRGVKRRR